MTTLASGSSVTFGLAVDQTFEMTFADGTTGTITVTGTLGDPYRTTFGPAKKNNWKPLPLGTTGRVVVACTAGSVSYTLGTSSFVTTVTDAVTGLVSGADSQTSGGRGLRTVLIGDSYIDREMANSLDLRTQITCWGSIAWANCFLGAPLQVIKEAGIGGERVSDILARADLIAAYSPQVIFVSCGINDLKYTANSGSSVVTGAAYPALHAAQMQLPHLIEQYTELLQILQSTGALIFLMGITSPANSATDQTKQLAHRAMKFNQWLQSVASRTPGIWYLPVDRVTFDATSAAGNVLSGYYSDTIHPSITAAFKRGVLIAERIKPVLQHLKDDRLPSNIVDAYTNLNVPGTALSCDGTTLTVTVANTSGGETLLRTGDKIALAVPSVGNTQWNGTYTLLSHSSTQVTMACSVSGTYTGTINMSAATQMFDNPLFTVQTGGSFGGGGTLTSGLIPSKCSASIGAGSSVIVTYAAHTDLDGVADGLGSWVEFEITAAANADFYLFLNTHRALASSSYTGRFMNGDTIKVQTDIELLASPSPSGVYTIEAGAYLGYTTADGTVRSGVLLSSLYRQTGNTDAHPNIAFRGMLETNEWTLPSGGSAAATSIDGYLRVLFGASGGTAKVRIGRFGVLRVDNPVQNAAEFSAYQ